MPLYDKPVWQLLKEAIDELGSQFTADEVVRWFQQRFPRVSEQTIRQHLRAFCANDGTKRYLPSLPHDLLFKMGQGRFRQYDADNDGLFDEFGRPMSEEDIDTLEVEPGESIGTSTTSTRFALELHLEEFMESNWRK